MQRYLSRLGIALHGICVQFRNHFPLFQVGIEAPTKAEFEAADLDGNGALLFNEWKDWVALQI